MSCYMVPFRPKDGDWTFTGNRILSLANVRSELMSNSIDGTEFQIFHSSSHGELFTDVTESACKQIREGSPLFRRFVFKNGLITTHISADLNVGRYV